MAIHVPVVRKYRVGDHVGLAAILAVGPVVARRGVVTGLGPDNGSGRYLVEFRGVSRATHDQLATKFCHCTTHAKLWRRVRRAKDLGGREGASAMLRDALANCESEHRVAAAQLEVSRIWYASSDLLNCCGKERLPLNVNVTYGTPPPYFDVTPMGTWNPTTQPRYAHGTNLG